MAGWPSTVTPRKFGRIVAAVSGLTLTAGRTTRNGGGVLNKGTLTLTLTLKPGKSGQIEIEDDMKAKVPVTPAK